MNKRELAYNKIREAITYGELKQGEKLTELDLCKTLNLGRTPIREAFRQLQMEGYLEVIPNKGAIIRKFSIQEVEWTYDTLSVLEGYAVELATNKITENDLDYLKAIQRNHREAAKEKDYRRWFDENALFHGFINRLAGNLILSEEIVRLRNRIYRSRAVAVTILNSFDVYLIEHENIIEALTQKNIEKVGKMMRTHIRNTKIKLLEFLRKTQIFY
jgi:DNA-binding GntR family transcriptional regulator